MVNVPASSTVDLEFQSQLEVKPMTMKFVFTAMHAALRSKNKDCLARNQNNVSS